GASLKRKISAYNDGRLFDRTVASDKDGNLTTTDVVLSRSGSMNKRTRSRSAQGRECLALTKVDEDRKVTVKTLDALNGVTTRMERVSRPQANGTIEVESKYWGAKGDTKRTKEILDASGSKIH
ncbi:MAG: hypothetical protein WB764_24690, partial [Xanthobacteraceae bacterium]